MKTIERLKTQGFRDFTEKDFKSFAGASPRTIIKDGKYCSYLYCEDPSNEKIVTILFDFGVGGEFSSTFVTCTNICNFCEIEEVINEALTDKIADGYSLEDCEESLKSLFEGWGLELKNLTI